MKNLQRNFERFCLRRRNWGIHNLMLYLAIGKAIVYIISIIDRSNILVNLLIFDRTSILHGQVWRLLSFLLVPEASGGVFGGLMMLIMLFFYYRIGLLLENSMGIFKFNLFYLTGVVLLDLFGLLFGVIVYGDMLSLSLIIAFATMYPEAQVLLFGIIPLKMKYLAWFYLGITALEMLLYRSLTPLLPLLNYILYFWSSIPNLLPFLARRAPRRPEPPRRTEPPRRPGSNWADGYRSKSGQKPYHHKCSVCGKTDTEYPDLEFRYCSKCNGYYCYCMDHINNHVHIQ